MKNLARLYTMFKNRYETYLLIFLSALFLLSCVVELIRNGPNPLNWDLMFLTGLVALMVGLFLAQGLPGRMDQTLDRLVNRHTLDFHSEKLDVIRVRLDETVNLWTYRTATVVALLMLVAFVSAFVYLGESSPDMIILAVFEIAMGYTAGFYIGRMVGYGQLGGVMVQEGIKIRVTPSHIDGAGGLKPIGDFYFHQAMIASIPAIYLAVWWFLIPLWPRYFEWRNPFLGLLLFAIAIEIAAFVIPLLSFHQIMRNEKKKNLKEADEMSAEIAMLESQLADAKTRDEQDFLNERLSNLKTLYWAKEKMPTWPLDAKTRNLFRLNNIALISPFLGKTIGDSELWKFFVNIINETNG